MIIKLNEDGFFTLTHSASDMGQGSDTVLNQIAAEVLDVRIDQVVVCSFDLDTLPYEPGAYASSGAYVTGNAVIRAAEDMKKQMSAAVARFHGVDAADVRYESGNFAIPGDRTMSLPELAGKLCSFGGMDLL